MDNLTLKTKKRAFPSHGRVRIHESRLTDLQIVNGDHIDLMNESAKKTVTVTVISDTMVGKDEIRVSEEDLKSLGLKEGDDVSIKKSLGLKEKVTKGAGGCSAGEKVGRSGDRGQKSRCCSGESRWRYCRCCEEKGEGKRRSLIPVDFLMTQILVIKTER